MDRIAIISDIHGNMPALEATLEDIAQRGIRRIFCLGDLVGKGPSPSQTVDRCREVCELTIRGNWDDGVAVGGHGGNGDWNREQLGPERLAYLGSLPNTIEFVMSKKRVRLFHASQVSIYHRVYMGDPRETHLAMFKNTPFTGDTQLPDVVGYGDIHMAYVMSFQHRILFNAGSIGNPLDLPQAAYAILEGAYEAQAGTFSVQIVRVPYDVERAIADAVEIKMPEVEAWASELRTCQYRGSMRPTKQIL